MNTNKMAPAERKFSRNNYGLGIFLIAAFGLILSACGGGGGDSSASAVTTSSTSPSSSSTTSTSTTTSSAGGTTTTTSTTSTSLPPGPFSLQVQVTDYQKSTSVITGIPGIASCSDATGTGTSCNNPSIPGSVLTLTANPATGYGVSWGGACASALNNNTCTLPLNANKSVTATFDPMGTTASGSKIWWISPAGSDTNSGLSILAPLRTIHKANTLMAGGDTLYFADGAYNDSLGGYLGAYNKDVKDGTSAKSTRFLAYHPNAATIEGQYVRLPLYLWHNNYVEIGYLRFLHSVGGPCEVDGDSATNPNFNATHIWIHDSACAYAMPAGPGANVNGLGANHCDSCLFERNWVWGFGTRYGVALYHGINNVIRGNVVRYDGAPDGQPKAGIVLYDEDNSIAENNISIDFDNGTDATSDVHASLFTTSSSVQTNYPYGLGTVSWYGNIAMNTIASNGSGAFYYDSHVSILTGPTGSTVPTFTAVDNIVAGVTTPGNAGGLWISHDDASPTRGANHNIVLNHNTVWNSNGNGIRIDNFPYGSFTLSNTIIHGGTFSSAGCYNKQWTGAPTAANNIWYNCDNTLNTAMPGAINANPLFSWLENVTSGPAFGAGTGGSNIGAKVVNKYVNGSLTGNSLWPFQNEASIKSDFCAGPDTASAGTCEATNATSCTVYTRGHNTTGLCASGKSLTKYVWEQLGTTSPY